MMTTVVAGGGTITDQEPWAASERHPALPLDSCEADGACLRQR
jgi:hypothetical protein